MKDTWVYLIGPAYQSNLLLYGTEEYKIPFKVGISKDVDKRLSQIQTSMFCYVEVIATSGPYERFDAFSIERDIHKRLKEYRSIGEWFLLGHSNYSEIYNDLVPYFGSLVKSKLLLLLPDRKNRCKFRDKDLQGRFKSVCKKARPYLDEKIFWRIVEGLPVYIEGRLLHPPRLDQDKALVLALSILGSDYGSAGMK